MEFDNSFFEDSDECEEDDESTPIEKVPYTVKRCESEVSVPCVWWKTDLIIFLHLLLQWFLQDDIESARDCEDHTLLKYCIHPCICWTIFILCLFTPHISFCMFDGFCICTIVCRDP